MNNIRKSISICLTFILTLLVMNASTISLGAEKSSINVIIKGNFMDMKEDPILRNDRTFIPIRFFAEELGFKVEWIESKKTAILTNSEDNISIPIGSKEVTLNGKKVVVDEKSFIEKGRTFIPLRAVSELLSQDVQWDQNNKMAIVGEFTSKEYVDGSLKDKYLYENDKYGFTFKIPTSLKEKLVIKEENNAILVYDKYNYDTNDKLGVLFSIMKTDNPDMLGIVPTTALKYDKGLYYVALFASDVQYIVDDKESTESYMNMLKLSKEFLPSFNLKTSELLTPDISKKGKIALVTDANLEKVQGDLQKPISLQKNEIAYIKNIHGNLAYVVLLRPMEPEDVDSVGYIPLENLKVDYTQKEMESNSIYGHIKQDKTKAYDKPYGKQVETVDSQYTRIEERQGDWLLIAQKGGAINVWIKSEDVDYDFTEFVEYAKNKKDKFEKLESLAGYMIIKDNTLYFNEVEIVQQEDKERIKELDLNEFDMPNGYAIINKNKGITNFELSEQVVYTFTDNNLDFVKDPDGNRLYTTAKKEEFIKHLGKLNDSPLSSQNIPFFIELGDGKVISITEEFKYTI